METRSGSRLPVQPLLLRVRQLFRAYLAKEQFEHAWTYATAAGIPTFIIRWRRRLNWTGSSRSSASEMLMRHIDGVTAWAPLRLTNAALEGNNSRVRGLSQRAPRLPQPDNLMLVLYHASWR